MRVVLVPYRDDGPERRAAWHYVARWLMEHHGWPLAVGAPLGEWVKAEAVWNALATTAFYPGSHTLIVHDADVFVAPEALRAAVEAVEAGAAWAIPHGTVYRLDEQTTSALLETGELPDAPLYVRWPYLGMAGGGIVVLTRDTYLETPLDRRFVGWGGEDQAWGWALETFYGPAWRGDAALYHLWHPHAAPGHQKSPRVESERLRRVYRAHRGHPDLLRPIVEAGR